jgi:hypothetical protein
LGPVVRGPGGGALVPARVGGGSLVDVVGWVDGVGVGRGAEASLVHAATSATASATISANVRIRRPTSASWHHRTRPAQHLFAPVDNVRITFALGLLGLARRNRADGAKR